MSPDHTFLAAFSEGLAIPTIASLRRRIAAARIELARREQEARRLEETCGPHSGICDCGAYEDAAMAALSYERDEIEPLVEKLRVAETAAREARAAERSDMLVALSGAALKCRESGSLAPLASLLEALLVTNSASASIGKPAPGRAEQLGRTLSRGVLRPERTAQAGHPRG